MELCIIKNSKGEALYIKKSVRELQPDGTKKPRKKTVMSLGYLEDLRKEYDDPVAHFREVARQMTEEEKTRKAKVNLGDVDFNELYEYSGEAGAGGPDDGSFNYMYGHLPLSYVYHQLEIGKFLTARRDRWGVEANLESITRLLVFGRVLFPSSKLSTYAQRGRLMMGSSRFSEDDVYRSLPFLASVKDDLVAHLDRKVRERYGRDSSLMYYDVTNYYYETDEDDPDEALEDGATVPGLRKRGCSKEHRPNPIVQLGLFMDADGIPVTYGIFPGNNNDVTTFQPMIRQVRDGLGMEGMIYVADKGMMSGDNVGHIILQRCGYVISSSVRKADAATVRFVLDDNGYVKSGDGGFKYKSRIVPVRRRVRNEETGKVSEVTLNEVQVCFWSRKYKERTAAERGQALEKAGKERNVFNVHGVRHLFSAEAYDKDTGEILEGLEYARCLDKAKLEQESALDGYYMICSNVIGTGEGEPEWDGAFRWRRQDGLFQLNRPVGPLDIIDMYRGLWRIEESFKLTKSSLRTRPCFVRKPESIEAHMLTCFLALLLVRVLELKVLKGKFSHEELIDGLRQACVTNVNGNYYMNSCCPDVMRYISNVTGLRMNKKYYTLQELRTLHNSTKKI